ncbi:MAG: hypothetical protein U9O20_05010 [Patescibacteria group bacterium]|nr:hypothetical protein [Patescibacteria group bacterium]
MKKLFSIGLALIILVIFSLPAEAIVLRAIEEQSPAVWGLNPDDIRTNKFVPKRGGIKVCKAEGKLIVGFYLSSNNIQFYSQTFSDGERKPSHWSGIAARFIGY